MTTTEASKRTGIPARTLRWAILKGWLKADYIGSVWLVTEEDVREYLSCKSKHGRR